MCSGSPTDFFHFSYIYVYIYIWHINFILIFSQIRCYGSVQREKNEQFRWYIA